jgi:hypothetical protein
MVDQHPQDRDYPDFSNAELEEEAREHPPTEPARRADLAAELRSRVPRTREAGAETITQVVVRDFDMPFWSMVGFMLKWAFASIPALIVLIMVGAIVTAILAAVGGVLPRR